MLVDTFSNTMSQNHSNPTGNSSGSGASFAEPFGNRVLSLTEVNALRRMTMQNSQQQQQNSGGGQQSQLPTNPFLVLTQVPVQATPFANFANAQGNQSSGSNNRNNGSIPQPQPQQQNQNQSFVPEEGSWAQLLQPTPLAPNHFHNSSGGGVSASQQSSVVNQPQSTRQLQHDMSQQVPRQSSEQPQPQGSSSSISKNTNNNSNNNNNSPFNPSTMSFLQELMMNAATAALQQQQQMMQQPNNSSGINNNNANQSMSSNNSTSTNNSSSNMTQQFMQGMGQAFAGRMQVDSSVCPVSRPDSNNQATGVDGVQAWKQMWDSASKTMFQQQHQLLQQSATGQDKFNNMNNSSSLPAQPAKRKYADLKRGDSNDNIGSANFHPVDGEDDDDDFLDIAPTPLSEIRAREQSESIVTNEQQQQQQQANFMPTMPQQDMSSLSSQWQNWNVQAQQQQQQQPMQQQIQQQVNTVPKPTKKPSGGMKQQTFILPSTMMPPTVLASTFTEQQAKNTNRKRRTGPKSARFESPHHALARIVQERGYGSKMRITSEEAGYDAVPSPLQLASFGTEVVKAVHTSNAKRLGELLSSGLSPNPCNQFRDSIVDLVCKRANEEIFQVLVEHGSELRVCDGFGRTPLHHCCWASEFSPEIADAILKSDLLQMFIEDKRGQTPLEYVRPNLADAWVEFLEEHKEEYFPYGGSIPMLRNVKELRPDGSLPDPPNSLSVPLAGAVSSGQVTPEEVSQMDEETKAKYEQ